MDLYEGLRKIQYYATEPFKQLFSYSQLAPVVSYNSQNTLPCLDIKDFLAMARKGGQDRKVQRGGGESGFRRSKTKRWYIEKGKNQTSKKKGGKKDKKNK